MAYESELQIILGTDDAIPFVIRASDAADAVCVDVSSYAMSFKIKRSRRDEDDRTLVSKASGGNGITVSGTFAEDPDTNEQQVIVAVADTDTDTIAHSNGVFELKRTDPGAEKVLAHGPVKFIRSVHRS